MKRVLLMFVLLISNKDFAQVNLQSGSPEINFPLFDISDISNRIGTSLKLVYVGANGIKVDDPGTYVGTGWDLAYGGSISRDVIGEPDDQKQIEQFSVFGLGGSPTGGANGRLIDYDKYVSKYFPNGYLYSEFSSSDIISAGGAYTFSNNDVRQQLLPPVFLADRQIDVFTFNLNGRTGKFLIGKSSDKTIFFLNKADSKLKIQVQFDEALLSQGMRTSIKGFTITDETGIQYQYNDMELSEIIKYNKRVSYNLDGTQTGCSEVIPTPFQSSGHSANCASSFNWFYNPNSSTGVTFFNAYEGIRTGQYICNKWMLSKIINPLSQKSIDFAYTTEEIVQKGSASSLIQNVSQKETMNVCISLLSSKIKKPLSISNQYGDRIEFIYGDYRQDFNQNRVLNKIDFYKNSIWSSAIEFSYGYFYKNSLRGDKELFTDQEKSFLRLSLQKIQKKGQNNAVDAPTQFTYFIGNGQSDIVPPIYSIYKDFFGYYNAWNGLIPYYNDNLTAPLLINTFSYDVYHYAASNYMNCKEPCTYDLSNPTNLPLVAKNGMIKTILYPKGASFSYEYEPNYLSYNSTNNVRGGGVRVKYTISSDNTNNLNDIQTNYSYINEDGINSSGWGYNVPINNETKISRYFSGSLNNKSSYQSFETAQKIFTDVNTIIGSSDKIGFLLQKNPVFVYMAINDLIKDIINPTPDPNPYAHVDYNINISYSDPINYNNLLPQMYSRVIVEQVNKPNNLITNGKTVYSFTSPLDYPLEEPDDLPLHSMKQRYGYWRYGLLKSKEIYGSSNLQYPIYRLENNYSSDPSNYNTSLAFLSQNWSPIKTLDMFTPYLQMNIDDVDPASTYFPPYIDNYSSITNPTNSISFVGSGATGDYRKNYVLLSNNIQSVSYYPFSGKVNLLSSSESIRDKNGITRINTTNYTYNSDNFVISKAVSKSSGEKFQTDYTYINDYTINSGVIGTLKDNNNISAAVSTENYIYPDGVTKYLLSGVITDYAFTSNNDIKPTSNYAFRNNSPLLNSSIQPFNSSQILRDPNYYKLVSQINYDNNGMPNQTIGEGNKISASIYDNTAPDFVLAEATNTRANDIAYTSFESNSSGNWGFGTNMISSAVGGITGKQSYDLTGGMWNNNLDPNKSYILTFWVNGPKPGINKILPGGGSQIIDPQFNYVVWNGNWALIKGTITGATGIGIWKYNNSVSVYLDEVRLCPSNSLMTTYTYDFTKGKTATTDVNNHITYYEYDDMARLKLIRDEHKNILKKFCYNYAGQPVTCDGMTYYNDPQTVTLTKNDCGTGYTGSTITYNITAHSYSSTISVADANQQALAAAQAYVNANGTCTATCSTSTCSGEGYKCVNGICELGIQVLTDINYDSLSGMYQCTYHYEWSDGSWSVDITINHETPC